jgi:hypothetical protein
LGTDVLRLHAPTILPQRRQGADAVGDARGDEGGCAGCSGSWNAPHVRALRVDFHHAAPVHPNHCTPVGPAIAHRLVEHEMAGAFSLLSRRLPLSCSRPLALQFKSELVCRFARMPERLPPPSHDPSLCNSPKARASNRVHARAPKAKETQETP